MPFANMEKSYKNISWFFVLVFSVLVFGFRNYFSQIPQFKDFYYVHHIHLFTVFIWFVLLFIQPVLICRKKIQLHKAIGRTTYIFVPVMVFFMLLVMKAQYTKMVAANLPIEFCLGFLYLPTAAMLPFIIIYMLAIVFRRNPKVHMRYMVATAISLLGPGIGRINFGINDSTQAIMFAFALSDLFFIGLLVFEFFKTKFYKPYVVSLLVCLFFHGIYIFFPATSWWQGIAQKFVSCF